MSTFVEVEIPGPESHGGGGWEDGRSWEGHTMAECMAANRWRTWRTPESSVQARIREQKRCETSEHEMSPLKFAVRLPEVEHSAALAFSSPSRYEREP